MLEIVTLSDVKSRAIGDESPMDTCERQLMLLRGIKISDPRKYNKLARGTGFKISKNGLDLYWGGYEYGLSLEEVNTPLKLINCIAHVGTKNWPGMTPARIAALTIALDRHFKWGMWEAA